MPWGAAVAAAGAIGGALISSNANKAANNAATRATDQANSEQQREYDLARSDYAPYREAGVNALNDINGLLKDPNSLANTPGYQFGLSQGVQARDRSAASAGGLYSGATLKALERYGQDYAGTKLNETFNRDAAIAGIGQVATSGTTLAGTNNANQQGNNMTNLGGFQAGAALNQGNIYSNALNQVVSSYGQRRGPSGVNWFSQPSGGQTNNGYGGFGTTLYGDGYGPQ